MEKRQRLTGDHGVMMIRRYGLMASMSLSTDQTYDGASLMLKLDKAVSPLVSS